MFQRHSTGGLLADQKNFPLHMQKIAGLVHELDQIADPAARANAKELLQLLMDLHGRGLERILEIIFDSDQLGSAMIDALGRDPMVGSLLILYGIHPEDLQTRVERGLEQIRSSLFKLGAEARLESITDGEVRIRITIMGHTCGSTSRTVRATLEDALYEAAPDATSLVVEGLAELGSSGFIGIEKLLASPAAGALVSPERTPAATSDGMD